MNLKSYFNFLSRNKVYAAVNIVGLSLSMMFVLIIGTYAWQEYHANSQYPKADRILVYGYNISGSGESASESGGHWRLQEKFRIRYPEIESSCAICGGKDGEDLTFTDGEGDKHTCHPMFADSMIFTILDIKPILGDAQRLMPDGQSMVVTDEFARRQYGSEERAMGKRMDFGNVGKFRITGVIPQFEHSSIPTVDVILPFKAVEKLNPYLTAEGMNNANGSEILFLERPGADLTTKTADMDKYQKEFFPFFQMDEFTVHTKLTPLSEYYFSRLDGSAALVRGDAKTIRLLALIGFVILLFAVFNYINLTNAISDKRFREMAMRRLVGASRGNIVARLMSESVLMCVLAMVIANLLAWAAVPYANRLLDTHLQTSVIWSPTGVLAMAAFTVVLGVVAGLWPAGVMSRAKPIDVVRGTYHFRVGHSLASLFIVMQNVATITLVALTLAMSSQVHYMTTLYRGYNTKNLIQVDLYGRNVSNIDAWYDGLRQLPQVLDATACKGTPYDGGNNNTYNYNGRTLSTQMILGDSHFMRVFQLKLLSERKGVRDSEGNTTYVNRQMLREQGLPMNSRFYYVQEWPGVRKEALAGVLSDFSIRTLDTPQQPLSVSITTDSLRHRQWSTVIQVQGDPVTAYRSVQRLYKQLFGTELTEEHPFIDQKIAAAYAKERQMNTLLTLFSLIAIVISVLGLVAMSTYYIDSRRREIAIRKVFGSTSGEVARRFIVRFMAYVGVAVVIAVPLTVWLYTSWLSQYSQRAVWWPWLIAAAAIVVLVSYVSVAVQTRHAARQNPADSMRQDG